MVSIFFELKILAFAHCNFEGFEKYEGKAKIVPRPAAPRCCRCCCCCCCWAMCLGHFVLSSLATSTSCNFGLLDRQSQCESNDLRTEDRQGAY